LNYLKVAFTGALLIGSLTILSANENNVPIGNVLGSTGIVFPEAKSRFVIKHVSVIKNNAYNGDEEVDDSLDRTMSVNQTNFLYRRGLGYGFDIRFITTYVQKSLNFTKMGTDIGLDNSGLGDSKIVSRYELLNQKKGAPLFLTVGAGIKLPTGSTDKTFSTDLGEMGPSSTQTMQLGSGSYDFISEIGASKILPNSRIDAHIMYTKTSEGDNNYQFGDTLQWNLGYSYASSKTLDIQIELDGLHTAKNESDGVDVDNTGGNFVYITPGIHIIPSKKYDLSLGYAYMIHRDNNYNSTSNSGGVSEDYKFVLRAGYNF
jgi:hypothetical protein